MLKMSTVINCFFVVLSAVDDTSQPMLGIQLNVFVEKILTIAVKMRITSV